MATPRPTVANPNPIVEKVQEVVFETLDYLEARWQDEKEYENIADYAAPIKKALAKLEGVEVIKMSARPFGFHWKASDGFVRHTTLSGNSVRTMRLNASPADVAKRQ